MISKHPGMLEIWAFALGCTEGCHSPQVGFQELRNFGLIGRVPQGPLIHILALMSHIPQLLLVPRIYTTNY